MYIINKVLKSSLILLALGGMSSVYAATASLTSFSSQILGSGSVVLTPEGPGYTSLVGTGSGSVSSGSFSLSADPTNPISSAYAYYGYTFTLPSLTGIQFTATANLSLTNDATRTETGFIELLAQTFPPGGSAPSFSFSQLTSSGTTTLTVNNLNFGAPISGRVYFHGYVTSVSPIPEPEEWALMLTGLGFMGWRLSKKKEADLTGLALA